MVFIDAEPAVRSAAASLEVRVEGSTGRGAADFAQRELSTLASPSWPVRVALSPLDGDGQRVYRVTATALDGATPTPLQVAQVRVISGYRPNESVRIDLLLEDACVHHAACAEDQTCVAGSCVAAMIDPATLAPLASDAGRADAAATTDTGTDAMTPTDTGADAGVAMRTETTTLPAPMGAFAGQQFGGRAIAVSADGSRVLVGVPLDTTAAGVQAGSARVFVRVGAMWSEEATLIASDGAAGRYFGGAVALSADGTRALIGGGPTSHAFVRTGTSWSDEATLTPSGPAHSGFGTAVALSSDAGTALIGYTGDAAGAGSARVFVRVGAVWSEQATLLASGGATDDLFGQSVALSSDGGRAIVGAPRPDASSPPGFARVFVRSTTTWTEEATLAASGGFSMNYFGCSVAMDSTGTRAVVGANRDNIVGTSAGSARVFVRSGSAWTEEATLFGSDGAPSDFLGWAVAITGDASRVLVGAPHDYRAARLVINTGIVRTFVRSGTTWIEDVSLVASDAGATDAAGDFFGDALAITPDGSEAIVGAPNAATAAGVDGGSVRIFTLP